MSEASKALIVTGDGINCEQETAHAFNQAGFESTIRHINDLAAEEFDLDKLSKEFQALAIPGGFSFGDDLSSGRVLALKIIHALGWDLKTYAERGGLVIGICNGFQALIRMGVFGNAVGITKNVSGQFINKWVGLEPQGKKCVWLRGLGHLDMPIRHSEGRIVIAAQTRAETMSKFERQEMMCLRYSQNVNGSEEDLAGLCDASGRIFGLMPHPEAFVRWTSHPDWTAQPDRAGAPGQGLSLFENAFREAQSSK